MMELTQAIRERHSVRSYTDRKIEGPVRDRLQLMTDQCSRESGLHIQLVLDEPQAFGGRMGGYGHFKNVRNYIALVGKKRKGLEEDCGYYGEKIVLYAQQLGLNTCWVGLTFSKIPSAFEVGPGEKLVLVIAVGYGADRHEPAEIHPDPDGSPYRKGKGRHGLLFQSGPGHRQISFRDRRRRCFLRLGIGKDIKKDLGKTA